METNYPGANKSLWAANRYPGVTFQPEKIVLHSTEGPQAYDYQGGAVAPTFTVDLLRGITYQHFPLNQSARALVNARGGVQTNTDGAIQIEIVGTCDPASKVTPYLPGLAVDKWTVLIDLLSWVSKQTGIPLVATPRGFKAYPASYGSGNGVRMTFSEWDSFRGVCGHQHVPENHHGDPGNIPVDAILAAALGGVKVSAQSAAKPAVVKSAPAAAAAAVKVAVDGQMGPQTVKALQARVGAVADGVMGPQTVKALQTFLGVGADGKFGPVTVSALQKRVGAPVDGRLGPVTVKALQVWLNGAS